MGELVGEDCSNCSLMVGIVGDVHEDGVNADVGVLCRMDPCEVLVLDEDWVVRRRQSSVAGRMMAEVDGVSLENVIAVDGRYASIGQKPRSTAGKL